MACEPPATRYSVSASPDTRSRIVTVTSPKSLSASTSHDGSASNSAAQSMFSVPAAGAVMSISIAALAAFAGAVMSFHVCHQSPLASTGSAASADREIDVPLPSYQWIFGPTCHVPDAGANWPCARQLTPAVTEYRAEASTLVPAAGAVTVNA